MKRVLFFVLCHLLVFDSYSQNLVINPEFDEWAKTDKPTGWSNTQGCLKDSLHIISDSYSCRQEATTVSRDLGQKFIVTPGKHYRFSLYYKNAISSEGNGCRIWCSWLDEFMDPIDDPSEGSVLHSTYLKSETWTQYSTVITAPPNAMYFYLLVRSLPNSITWWDDFVFEEDILSSNNENQLNDISVYPNPVSNYLTINNIHQVRKIAILNLTGAPVWSHIISGESSITIPVSGIADGLYILRIKIYDRLIIRRFIKVSK
jgi:hypothetical protein